MNVVPLVDVVLVLLIIFMVTAHAMESGLDIEVPQVKEVKDTAEDLPMVQITKSGNLYLNDKQVNINQLSSEIEKRFKGQKSVYIIADKRGLIDQMVQVMSILGRAQFKVSVVAKEEELQKK
jgi:biopolymer transport protein ExbD